jgi:hypothetical protein
MFEPTDELLQKAADTANKAMNDEPSEHDIREARLAWNKGQLDFEEQNMSSWGYIAFGFIQCARQMAEEKAQ